MGTRTKFATLLAALAWTVSAGGAETIYKSIGARGEVSYGWAPAPGAVRFEPVEVERFTPAQRDSLGRLREEDARLAKRADAELAGRRAQWNRTELELKAAHSQLRRAENALERSIAEAKGRLDRSYAARNAL